MDPFVLESRSFAPFRFRQGGLPCREPAGVSRCCGTRLGDFLAAHQLINLLGEYDFSDEKLQDNVGIRPQKLTPKEVKNLGVAEPRYVLQSPGLVENCVGLYVPLLEFNRGENTVGTFAPDNEAGLAKVDVGIGPNGLAYDPGRGLLLAANAGDPQISDSFTLSIVNVKERRMMASVRVPGRTRWTVFEVFYVNIADRSQIVVLPSDAPDRVARTITIPAAGPHGLDFDSKHRRLFCACDAKQLVILNPDSGEVLKQLELSGSPDVIFFNRVLRHLYVAIGDPGVVEVFDTDAMERLETVRTEPGAHTLV